MDCSTACLARAIFSPDMEPERSSTNARFTGGRRRAPFVSVSGAGGAVISARMKRWLRSVDRM